MSYHGVLTKNESYFDTIDTEAKAYFLGLLFADGHNNGRYFTIGLHERDRDILEQFSREIFGKVHLYTVEPRRYVTKKGVVINASRRHILQVYSPSMCASLNRLGMIKKKSIAHDFPSEVPAHLVPHFVRGYFDGDGCITRSFSGYSLRYSIKILSSPLFCKQLQSLARSHIGITMCFAKLPINISAITVRGNRQVQAFTDWMYRDATVFMPRKHNVYLELCKDTARRNSRPKTSQYIGVFYYARYKKWHAGIGHNGKRVSLGLFQTEEEAFAARRKFEDSVKTGTIGCAAP